MIGLILENNSNRAVYVFKTLFSILGFEHCFIHKREAKNYPVVVYYGNNFNLKVKYAIEIPKSDNFIETIKEEPYKKLKNRIKFNIDFISLSFFLLTREEELQNKERDEHKRFDYSKTILKEFIKEPLINRYIGYLEKHIIDEFKKQKKPLLKKAYWPDAKDFAVSLTHDVDVLYKYSFFECLSDIKKSLTLFYKFKFRLASSKVYDMVKSLIKREQPYWQLYNMADLETAYGFRSTFYFCSKKRHLLDPNYNIMKKEVKNGIKQLNRRGFEIGLHGSYSSYLNFKKLREEKMLLESVLGREVKGNRQHFVRFEVPYSWRLQNKLFSYDSTAGYINMSGFRPSICFPFRAYDILNKKELSLIEAPFNTSEGVLFGYMQLNKGEAWRDTKMLIDKVRKNNGLIILDWHQRTIYEKDFPGFRGVYIKALRYIKKLNAYTAPLFEVVDWWKSRVNLSVKFNRKNRSYYLNSKKWLKNMSFFLYNADRVKIGGNKDYSVAKNKDYFLIKFKKLKKAVISLN